MTLWHHSDKNSSVINNRYLDFVQKCGLISLVNDNHMDSNLNGNLVYVYYGSIVTLRKHAYSNILKFSPPKTENF